MEIMVAMAIFTLILGAILSSYILSARMFTTLSNYTYIHTQGRNAADWFADDVRVAAAVSTCDSSGLVLVLPTGFDGNGNITGTNVVRHTLANSQWLRVNLTTGQSNVLAQSVSNLLFTGYDVLGSNTVSVGSMKAIQADLQLSLSAANHVQSEDFLSVRMDLRN